MKRGIVLPQQGSSPDDVMSAASMAEGAGLDSVWVFDHLRGRPDPTRSILEGWVCLSSVAAATNRIGVGTLVLRESLRNPVLTATMVNALAKLAPGRVTIGLGAGDETIREEQEAAGIYFPDSTERYNRLNLAVQVLKRRAPAVPVWLGGRNERINSMLPSVDGWNYWGDAKGFAEDAKEARKASGSGTFEVSWAGRMKHYDHGALNSARPDHIVLATSPQNYASRIEFLQGLK